MGQSVSTPKVGLRKLHRSSLARRSRSHQSALSHTFTLMDNDDKIELLNINLATEEELMTLPGINREIARNIVSHRKAIGRFRKVEDLALVRGIGADKLEQMRPEICVTKRVNCSRGSSRAQSVDSLKSQDSRVFVRSSRVVNVNKASVFELQGVHGITQEIAANIVEYRGRKGPFKKVDDLIKVKGVDRIRLSNISQFLTISDDLPIEAAPTAATTTRTTVATNGIHTGVKCNGVNNNTKLNGINGTVGSLLDIFELLSAYSPRAIPEEIFDYERQGEPAVRIAVWNLNKFTLDKATNLGVREVVCRSILENGWSIIAVQDIMDIKALQLICDELNKPKLRKVIDWKKNSKDWTFSVLDTKKSGLGFLFDSYSGGVEVELTSMKQGPKDLRNECEIAVGTFKIGYLNVQLINARVGSIEAKLRELGTAEDVTLLLGEIPNDGSDSLRSLLSISSNEQKPENNHHHRMGNILGNVGAQSQFTGISGVVRDGLSHLAIPSGWNWGGEVSPFYPVWIEIFITPNSGTAL